VPRDRRARSRIKTQFSDGEWLSQALTAAWPTQSPRGDARREHRAERAVEIRGTTVTVPVPRDAYFARLEEIALSDVLGTIARAEVELAELYGGTLAAAEEAAS